ncbi:MAG: hypothetical protein ABFC90_01115 [Bacteroidales bacterium]|nr:hypothetical protein [Bacteroidales bacterium]MEA4841108.1 hypothetical protein [Bacteroidales bacterium]
MKKGEQNSTKVKGVSRRSAMLRNRTVTITLNDPEYKALEKYCVKYKITNRARFIRESLMKSIITRMSEDYPTLFGENEMR